MVLEYMREISTTLISFGYSNSLEILIAIFAIVSTITLSLWLRSNRAEKITMSNICAADGCVNQVKNDNPGISLFRFPKEECYIAEWQKVCRNKKINSKHECGCSVSKN
ncbi:uncharacterized protein LOC117169582 isoform X2 [Belonocnema kinseyi]|uniref:uncharacterized protein LOC117169582 isoform X2 n=1 Tax=Belonocnema kinseyi TaxID=2817044 RepID=UPI00143D87E5|nr:uncharacterized protein LOC117169582 isoform X2 [Belonocnema kinseyi]